MQGDIGTEDDFVTPRPDTLKLTAPGATLNDDEDARPSTRHSTAGATWALWTGTGSIGS
jgi:hypothetical protein